MFQLLETSALPVWDTSCHQRVSLFFQEEVYTRNIQSRFKKCYASSFYLFFVCASSASCFFTLLYKALLYFTLLEVVNPLTSTPEYISGSCAFMLLSSLKTFISVFSALKRWWRDEAKRAEIFSVKHFHGGDDVPNVRSRRHTHRRGKTSKHQKVVLSFVHTFLQLLMNFTHREILLTW